MALKVWFWECGYSICRGMYTGCKRVRTDTNYGQYPPHLLDERGWIRG